MRTFVRIINLLGAVLFLGLAVLAVSMGSMTDGAGGSGSDFFAGLVMLCPLIYCVTCFVTTYARHRKKWVLSAGIAAHVCLLIFSIAVCWVGEVGVILIYLSAVVIGTGSWVAMYLGLKCTGEKSGRQQSGR